MAEAALNVDTPRAPRQRETHWLRRTGPAASLIADHPWDETPLGPLEGWPDHLRTVVNLILGTGAPMALCWGPEFRLIYNDSYARVIDGKHPAACGAPARDVFPESWDAIEPLFQQAGRGEAINIDDWEVPFNRSGQAKTAYFSFSYNPVWNDRHEVEGFLAVVSDTTDRVVREQHRTKVFDTVLSTITDFAYAFDTDGRFVYVNKALLDLWGLRLEDAVGRNFHDLKYPLELAERLQRQIQQVFTERRVVRDETEYVSPTGVDGYYEYIFSPVYAADGSVSLVAGSTRDITRRKKLETAALAASRAKDDFIAALSHELRTPLTPALMTANELRDDPRLPPDVRAQLSVIERNIALEARLIDDLLDLTAISRGKLNLQLQRCDVHALIALAVEIVRLDASAKEIVVHQQLAATATTLQADPARIQQVMWNLLRNAVKFTPVGGSITIRTRDAERDGRPVCRIEVVDTGIGIEPAALDCIFNPFEQGGLPRSHRFGGLGLGLSIARAVVNHHGGQITAASDGPGRGATFIVEVPVAIGSAGAIDGARSPAVVAPRISPLRLLLVEDHPQTLHAIVSMLRRDGHMAIGAATIAEALAAAEQQPFDLVISDLGLPDGSGVELMSRLRAEHGLRGIALSGYGMEDDVNRSLESGFVVHLTKPVAFAQLRRALASIVAA